jgi:hypothetical protein
MNMVHEHPLKNVSQLRRGFRFKNIAKQSDTGGIWIAWWDWNARCLARL